MTVFVCRDTFEGILCGVYDGWTSGLGHDNVCLEIEDTGNVRMFADYRRVEEEDWKFLRVEEAVIRRAGRKTCGMVYRASLSREEEKADRIYRFLIYALSAGRDAAERLQIPAVNAVFQMNRSVENEANRLIEFLRFRQIAGGALLAVAAPKNDVIALTVPHFVDRMNAENWIICDKNRRKAAVHRSMGSTVTVHIPDGAFWEKLAEPGDQQEFEELWKTFCRSIAIGQRTNPRCQMNHLPLRYRPYMTEFT